MRDATENLLAQQGWNDTSKIARVAEGRAF
jgi:hypothetical protein